MQPARPFSAHSRTRGTSVFEFVLILPAAALVIVFMIGAAQTVLLRQYALIAARQSAFYQRVTGCVATPEMIGRNIPAADSPWNLGDAGQPSSGNQLSLDGGGDVADVVTGFIGGALGSFSVRASNTPRRGFVARQFHISDATADYSLIKGYWGDSHCSVMMAALGSVLGQLGSILHFGQPEPGGGC